jgi:hypothetical protein
LGSGFAGVGKFALRRFLEGLEVVFEEFHFAQRHEVGESRFGPLVKIDAIHVEAVTTTAGGGIIKGEAEIVAAKEPLEGEAGFFVPGGVVGGAIGLEAGGDSGVRLDGLLVEFGGLAALVIKSFRSDGAEMAETSQRRDFNPISKARGLSAQRPLRMRTWGSAALAYVTMFSNHGQSSVALAS